VNAKTAVVATFAAAETTDVTLVFGGDEEMGAHSQVLALASPVFASMLTSPMAEAGTKRINVDTSGKKEFTVFYQLINPLSARITHVTKDNVDAVLNLADYYQVEHLKQECEEVLLSLEPSVGRLLQADQHFLMRQYNRCADAIAKTFPSHDFSSLVPHPTVFMDVFKRSQEAWAAANNSSGLAVRFEGRGGQ